MRKAKVLKWVMMGALALTVMSGTGNHAEAAKGTVSITKKNFPCKELRAELKKWYDLNDDGKLTKSEARRITSIQISTELRSRKKISLKGMKYLTNLKSVHIFAGNVCDLDLSHNKKLKSIDIGANNVTGLKFSGNRLENFSISAEGKVKGNLSFKNFKKLRNVYFEMGAFDSVDFSGSSVQSISDGNYVVSMKKLKLTNCKKLRRLDLTPFDMKSLDIKGTTGFRVLNINTEAVRKIDVSKMKNLRELSLRGANITKLSVKKNKKLEKLNVSGTKIKKLDLSANNKLEVLRYGDNKRITKMFAIPHPERIKILDISKTKIAKVNLSKYTAVQELHLSALPITTLDLKNCKKISYLYVNDTKKLKTLDLSAQTKLENIELSRSNVEELDIRNSLLVCDHDEGGSGIGLSDCKKLRKIIVNKELKELKDFQDSAKQDGLNIEWVTIQ